MSSIPPSINLFLKEKRLLILTENSTDKTAWKKLFHELGISQSNSLSVNTLAEATEIIETKDIHILFSSYMMGDSPIMELVDLHNAKHPDRSEFFFFMASDKNSLAVAACAAEHDIDTLLIKPYTLNDLTGQICRALLKKIKITKEECFYYKIKEDLVFNNLENISEKLEKYKQMRPESPGPVFLEGLYFKNNKDIESAVKCWKDCIEIDQNHHKALTSLFDTLVEMKEFEKAYQYAEILCDKFPINPERIPNFIRVSLATKNYQNLIDFCEMILEVESNLAGIKRPIAAALAICGKNLAEDEDQYQLVKKASLKAIDLTDNQSKIFYTSVENLITCGDSREASNVLDTVPTDEMTKELSFLELVILSLDEKNAGLTFGKAQNLVKLDFITPEVYEILIQASIHIAKKKSFIEDLIFDAKKKFPQAESRFELLD